MTDQTYIAFGRSVRTRRDQLRLTQADLAARVGLSRASIANIEGGRQAVLLHQFLALADALSASPMDLIPSKSAANLGRELPEEVIKFMRDYTPNTETRSGSGP